MALIEAIAAALVVLAALYFLALGAASLVLPSRANRFLLGFAGSQAVHYTELLARFVVGAALVLHAPRMYLSDAFNVFGWILLVTTACLLLLPWRWHRRFAQHVVPRAIRHLKWIGLTSLACGSFILAAVVRGSAT